MALPLVENLPSADMIIYRYQEQLRHKELASMFARYYTEEPISDWSGALWRLLLLCFELGMTAEEVFVIAKSSKSNKYERDGRPDSHLWREVIKAELEQKSLEVLLDDHQATCHACTTERKRRGVYSSPPSSMIIWIGPRT